MPKLGADLAATSVSGLSSGAYMAGQIEVAHAKDIVGAGIVAGGPYACAESAASRIFPFWPTAVAQNGTQALYQCMKTSLGKPDPETLAARAKELADDGAIDPIAELAQDNVYLYSGHKDDTVELDVVKAAKSLYEKLGVAPGNMTLIEGDGGHAFITTHGGAACDITGTPYVANCGYDQAKAILAWIYGPLAEESAAPSGKFILFDQGNSPSLATASPTKAWSMCRKAAPSSPAAGCISRCMAASSRARRWATPSSRTAAMPRWPTPTGSSSCSRK